MLAKLKIPKTLLWVINLAVIFMIIFTLFRLATYFAFRPAGLEFPDLIPSFLLGIRYDLRWIAIILLPITIISLSQNLSPFYSEKNKRWWTWYLAVITFVVFFFFAADFGNFSYNNTRLNASALNFVEDAGISLAMLWQSYPIFWLMTGLLVAVLFFRWIFRQTHWSVIARTEGLGIQYRRKWFVIATIILLLFVFGSFSTRPLTWKSAFAYNDSFKSYLALNPLQNFFTTLKFRKPQFNEVKARDYFPVMAQWIPLNQQSEFSYRRVIFPETKGLESKPNVVLVLCESFSMYKSTMSGNPLNTTPYFDEMTRQGIFFEKCFTPHFSTARGLFALVTGIPDVQLSKFSTRNPQALNQHTIINNFEGYDKMYFLGGNPEFNNFEGLLGNIRGLRIYSEKDFTSPKVNVWGISDKNLFLEASRVFSGQQNPFFAIIQTADNHRPFMIPEEDREFEKKIIPRDTLRKYGFESLEEYQSFCYTDYCIRQFIENAKKQSWFHNTIFVFVGDHGVSGNATAVYPPVWTEQRLTDEHVPLLFFAPYLLQGEKRSEVVSMIDVLPTVAGMIQQPYVNTTLGRDLLDHRKKRHFAFIIYHDEGRIGVITDDYYFTRNLNFPEENLYPIKEEQINGQAAQDSARAALGELSSAIFETARWMLMNNKQ